MENKFNIFRNILKDLPNSKINIIPDDLKDKDIDSQMSVLINLEYEKLNKILMTLILDYSLYLRKCGMNSQDVTVAHIRDYCRRWIDGNLKESLRIDI